MKASEETTLHVFVYVSAPAAPGLSPIRIRSKIPQLNLYELILEQGLNVFVDGCLWGLKQTQPPGSCFSY